MAALMSMVALSIDAMLPALAQIGHTLGSPDANSNQLVISALFLGFGFGQLLYGPMADALGRKPAIYTGLGLFLLGSIACMSAQSFPAMLAGRFLQGLGVASPRTITLALVRDQYLGPEMARIMSLIMAVFILTPALAPALGQVILLVAPWRAIFAMLLLMGLLTLTWFALRQPETLPAARRVPFSLRQTLREARSVFAHRRSLAYMVVAGLSFGAFVGYLTSAQQLLQEQFGLGEKFPLYFGALALCIGAGSITNSRLLRRFEVQKLTRSAIGVFTTLSTVTWCALYLGHAPLSLTGLMLWGGVSFFCMGFVFGNANAMAMAPFGHMAGVAAAVVGAFSTFVSVTLGTLIGQSYDGAATPLIGGFALLGALALGILTWAHARPEPVEVEASGG
ncbi:putative Bcr/CflA subfamily drug resistance transporter [Magnetofaba australis IT-1]|uniref:Bcr/CflA family efflux transporter n=2 Tax=Magnetofaba TaxID=1472292 RepID=A0A1Y2K8N8_9PROT|nr:putative Bcr/CflA subfamily drug resistance transporter [Magnetofaba australis IT-1]